MSLTVEAGSGLSNADSYISVADADSYHALHGDPSTWSASSTANKEAALRLATQYLDNRYGLRWHGRRINSSMSLDWPRYYVVDRDGWTVAATTVPAGVASATAYVALKIREGDTLVPDVDPGGTSIAESVTVGPISVSSTYSGEPATAPYYPVVDQLLRDLIQSHGTVTRA